MNAFSPTGSGVQVRMGARERQVVGLALDVLAGFRGEADDPASQRLSYDAHPDDPDRSREFADLVAGDLERQRLEDRAVFLDTLDADELDPEQADAWLRVLGEARLVLGARLGIVDDDWPDDDRDPSPQMALFRLLAAVQDELVVALLGADPL